MKKHLNFIFLSIIAIAVSSLVSWDMPFNPFRKKLDLDLGKYSEPKKEDDSYMKVLQVSPKGEVPEGFSPKEVVLVFNHPLIPLGTLEEETKGVFQISPEIKGKFRWYGSRICAFIPSEPWDLRQEYTIRVSGDLKAINGKSMKESFQSTFKLKIPKLNVDLNTAYTEDPEMDYDYQEYSYNTSEDIRPIQKFSLSFSQKVSEKQVNKKLSIIADGKSIPFILVGEKDKKSFTFINTKPFSKSSNVMVRLEPGLESLEYSGNYTDDILKVYKSWGDLEIEMKDCDFQYFQSRWYCRFVFNHPVQGENAIRAIQVSPDMQMSQKPKGPIRRLKLAHWRPVSGKSYTFSFSSKLKDIFGYELGKKEVFQIKVPEYKPDFSVDSYYSVLESKMQSKLPIDIANIPAMNVKVGKLSLDSIHKKMQFKPEWKNGSYTYFDYFAHASNTKEHLWKTGSSKYKGQRYGYDLSPYLNSNKKGWLAVRFNNKITQFVQSTDLGITVKEDYKKA
ncbi:MAG: hypothetical protein KDK45_09550, partial [Leptospiraceae bacterium]|nr:hypothetical protein [Leptospiraceae bacterium]